MSHQEKHVSLFLDTQVFSGSERMLFKYDAITNIGGEKYTLQTVEVVRTGDQLVS